MELYELRNKDQPADAYIKWVMSHGEKGSGQLHDLFLYMSALMKSRGVNVQGCFPGTKEPRRIKTYS